MEAETGEVVATKGSLRIKPMERGNNSQTLVSMAAVMHVTVAQEGPFEADPREAGEARRLVLRFNDAAKTIRRTFLDRDFNQDAEGVHCRVFNESTGMLETWVVPMLALKAVFTVQDWDSKDPGVARSTDDSRQLWAQ